MFKNFFYISLYIIFVKYIFHYFIFFAILQFRWNKYNPSMNIITWSEFESVELRVGTIIRVDDFPEARKPAYKLWVDFGGDIGVKQSSAQITVHYTKEELIGKQIVWVVNFPPKQIGPFISEFLCTGFYREDGSVILAIPDRDVGNGAKLG